MTKNLETKKNCHNIHANFSKIPNNLIRTNRLTPTEKVIGIVLLSYNPSFPSYEKIMENANVKSRTTIANSLKQLKRNGFFEVVQDSNYKSNLYRYIDSRMDPQSPENELEAVHELDTNKTNSIILNNHINGSPAPSKGADEPINAAELLKGAFDSLGNEGKYGYKEKERPTFIVEAMNK